MLYCIESQTHSCVKYCMFSVVSVVQERQFNRVFSFILALESVSRSYLEVNNSKMKHVNLLCTVIVTVLYKSSSFFLSRANQNFVILNKSISLILQKTVLYIYNNQHCIFWLRKVVCW